MEQFPGRKKDLIVKALVALAALAGLAVFICVIFTGFPGVVKAIDDADEMPYLLPAPSDPITKLEHNLMSASFIVYAYSKQEDISGTTCSATAFARRGNTYQLLTNAHCVAADKLKNGLVDVLPMDLYVAFSDSDTTLFPARLLAVGYRSQGDDFAVLEVDIDESLPVIPLSKADPRPGESVINVSFPYVSGKLLGKRLVHGEVTHVGVDFSLYESDNKVIGSDVFITDMFSGGGSSGSAIVSPEQNAIVGVLTGAWCEDGKLCEETSGFPISKFRAFWEASQAGEYPWYKPNDPAEYEFLCEEDSDF